MSYLEQVKKPVAKAPVITIVGFPGVGKTTLGALFPNPIFIQGESSSGVFDNWDESVQPALMPELPRPNLEKKIRTSDAILAQLKELITIQHEFKTVVIDSITSLNTTLESEILAFDQTGALTVADAAGGFHKGYGLLAQMHADVRMACEYIRRKGIAVVFLAHTGIVKMKNRPDSSEYTAYTIDMHEKSRRVYVDHSDAVMYLKNSEIVSGVETNKKGQVIKYGRLRNTGDRLLITSSDGTVGYIDAKNRYDMPQELEVPKGENPILEHIKFFNVNVEKKDA